MRGGDGVYLNGRKIVLKGVNRHAFWPETGRTVSREQSYADVRLMKEANLNAVRMSHYPPDEHFLEACDELGLYVLDELSGWQKPYGLAVGARLIGELVRRDVNHPSVLMWNNGNEGGWNEKNDVEFAKWDPQARPVLHPWAINSGINTDHYERYDSTVKLSAGPTIFMPTEFLHGLYDGGIGAGFRDYWDVMGKSPTVAGGFFWVWADEGVVRTDQDGRIDTAGNWAPDGITGPHREKEGSFFTVKEILVADPGGVARGRGGRAARDRGTARSASRTATTSRRSTAAGSSGSCCGSARRLRAAPHAKSSRRDPQPAPPLAPRTSGTATLGLPKTLRQADALHVTAKGANGESLWTWSARLRPAAARKSDASGRPPSLREEADALIVAGPAGELRFDRRTGDLAAWKRGAATAPIAAGPMAQAFVRRDRAHSCPWAATARWCRCRPARTVAWWSSTPGTPGRCAGRRGRSAQEADAVQLDYEYAFDGDADLVGVSLALPATGITSKRWLGRGPYRVYRNRLEGTVFDLHQVA